MPDQPVLLAYQLTDAELRSGQRLTLAGRTRQVVGIVAVLGIALAIALGGRGMEDASGLERIVNFVFFGLLGSAVLYVVAGLLRSRQRTDGIVVQAFDQGLRYRQGDLEWDMAWPTGERLVENRLVLVVTRRGRPLVIVPKRAFSDEQAIDAFRELARSGLARPVAPYEVRGPRPVDPELPSTQGAVRLNFALTKAEVLRAQLVEARRPATLVYVLLVAGLAASQSDTPVAAAVGGGFLVVLFIVAAALLGVVRRPTDLLPCHLVATDHGLEIFGDGARSALRWTGIKHASSALDLTVLRWGRALLVVPHRAFRSAEEHRWLDDLVDRNVGKRSS